MSAVEQIVKNESLDDIVAVFALTKPNPLLDMMIRRYNPDLLKGYGTLENAYSRLFAARVLAIGESGLAVKGPNWTPPSFMLENKYS
ncbi:hypothetical protein ACOI9X_20410 [Pseudomonas sp. P2757]|uniref:hypothetical protein n=1 Tax=unclassified Pseudomonas TaxID=196821 RepID=UPI003B5C7945